ncbi:titin-like [Ostrinia furnacalis]|uniref:titin-like n=1 Tax=Ostrinia furnacalis TaxID=93504 RepID=UPI001040CDF6|nr:titin-like [Ostrinia furnacalis]
MDVKLSEAQHPENVEGPQFTKLKLKKPSLKPKQEVTQITLPKFQLKSRIRYVNDWPPQDIKPVITYLGSVRQNGELSRNIKEASKIKKKPLKLPEIPDLEKVKLEEPEKIDFEYSSLKLEKPCLISPENAEVVDITESPSRLKPTDDEKTPLEDDKVVKTITPTEMLEEPKENQILPSRDKPTDEVKPLTEDTPTDEPRDEQMSETEVREDFSKPIVEKSEIPEELPQKTSKQKPKKPSKKEGHPQPDQPDLKEPVTSTVEMPNKDVKKSEPVKIIAQDEQPAMQEDLIEPNSIEKQVQDTPISPEEDNLSPIKLAEKKPKKTKKKEVKEQITEPIKENVPDYDKQDVKDDFVENEPEIKPVEVEKRTEKINDDKKIKKHKDTKAKDKSEKPEENLVTEIVEEKPVEPLKKKMSKLKLTPITIERKTIKLSQAQHAENVESPQFTKLKLKKTITKPKPESATTPLPKFQLKSRITYVRDWPPKANLPLISFLGSVRQNGILSRNVKEAAKIKKKVFKQPEIPDIEKTELEKPMFGHEDIIQTRKQSDAKIEDDETPEQIIDDEPEQVTLKPRRPSVKKSEEIVDEVTIKKKLKPLRKSSVTLPEITEPENVTFRPKSTKTKEDVEQEFSIHLDSYAEEEISMSSKVKLKPQRHPTFNEEANEASIKFYEEEEEEGPEIVEIMDSDEDKADEMAHVMMPLKKKIPTKTEQFEEISSSVTLHKPKKEQDSEITQDVEVTLGRKPKYSTENQEEVIFDVKPQKEQYTQEELSLSSKVKLKAKKKVTVSEAADETSIRLTQEVEDDSQQEEIIISEAESEENIEMVIKRKPKKPAYEVSEIEELSVDLKPSRQKADTYEEEQLTILAKRKPRKPSQLQEADVSMSIAREQEFPETPLDVRSGDTVFAVYSYVAETDEAINLVEGERLYILETTNQDWWFVRKHLTEEKGWVPAQYLMDEANYTLYLQKKLNEKIDKLPVFEKPASEEQAKAPIFVEKLRPKHTPDGSTVQFECQVEGYPRPQITWFRQTAIIKPSQDFQMYYDDDNVATLVIREVFPEDAGTFTCVAKNAAGFASSTTELVVEAPLSDHGSEMTILSRKSLSRESSLADILEGIPPTFSKRPKAQYVDEGSQIFLECRLVAIPEPDIAWFFKGEEIIPDENISVATESDMHMYCSVLKVSNVKKFQEGTYTVLAVNREGEASLPIVLKIKTGQKEKPQVIEPLKSMTIREGESVVLTTQVVGNPQPKVTWYRNNVPIKSQTTKTDGDTHTITIIKPKKGKDDGVYSLKAVNSEGSTETNAVITIEEPTEENAEPPLFINRFQEITVKEKGTIKLVARVTGNPVPTITWYRNNQIITPSNTVTQTFDGENIQLIITNVDSEIDSGDYKCVASNSAGKASHGARVTIDVDKVTFVKNLQNIYEIEEGKTVVLECQTSHTVSTKWYHNDQELSGMDHREIIQEGRTHKLRIKKTKLTDVGIVKCVVKGQETSTKLIVHETIPEFVRKLQDFEVKERDIAILEVEINSETADVFWEKDGERIKPKKNKYDLEKRGNVRKLFIRNTSVHDEGEYTCILRDDTCTAEVTVVELPPEIISRLQDQKVSKGNKAIFEIELTKGDALVRWFKDGSEIQFSNHIQLTIDGKKQKLKIYDTDSSDAGEYSCEVGSDRCAAKLTVEEPSVNFVLRLPEVIVVPANTDAYLTVQIPDETQEVIWYKKKSVLEDTEKYTLISDVMKRTLIIRKCTEEDQHEYSCTLLDAKCSTKLIVEVLESPPRIVEYDKEYRVKRGNDVVLNVQYEAIPQPNDEWVVNSKIIKKTKHTRPQIDSVCASLTIKKVEHTDAGVYKLRLENNCGEAEVDVAVVVLDIPSPPGKPNILETSDTFINICWDEPSDKGGSEINFYVVEYQEINTSEWISIENITKTQQAVVNLKNKSSYRFRVYAINEVGVSECSEPTEYVRVEKVLKFQPPTVEKPLKDVISAPEEDVELVCIFGGIPQPQVTWVKDGMKLTTAKTLYENRVATLVVTSSEKSEGLYQCIATNEHGEAETSCNLEIQLKPIITIPEKDINQKRRVGEKWSITASVKGIPTPSICWYRNGSKIEKSKEIQISSTEETSTITISQLERTHTGKYTIEAQNKAGTSTVELSLRVYDKPSKPEGPVVMREISRESVTIEWKPPLDDGGLELTKYAIEKHEPETDQWIKVADVDKSVETYCIQRLNENCEYMFRIMAQNPIGFSEALESEPIVIKTALDVPSPPLGPLGLYGIDSNSLTVVWYPSERNGGAPILDYSVEIKQEGKKWKQVATVNETQAKIEKLSVNTTYQFRICARNEIGTSLPYISDEKITIGKTLSPPSQPRSFVVRETTSRSVTLQWAAPESDGGSVITNYIIEYKILKGKSWSKVVTVSGSVYEHCIENIKEKELVFRISAENAIGVSLPAESQTVSLEKHATVPSPPTAPLEIRMVGSNIVMTSWGTPEWDGGAPLLGYNIAIRDVTKTMWMEVGKVDAHTLKFAIRDLNENHTYMIRIYARNEIGISEPLESDEPFKVEPGEDSHADEEAGEHTEATEPTSFSTQTTTSWLRDHNMDADIRSYARGSLLRRDEYFFRIWHYAKQLFK